MKSRITYLLTGVMSLVLCGTLQGAPVEQYPPKQRTAEERKEYEKKVDWFYQAKFGIMFHFVPNMHRFRAGRIEWTSEKWNAWVDAVDVEKVADQAQEIGAGYVILSIGQGGGFSCAPNPVLEKYWGLEPGEATSRRDLPMDLYKALKKRGIRMMFYTACEPSLMPGPKSEKVGWFGKGYKFNRATPGGCKRWAEVLRWYSDHYGEAASGWWLDGLNEWAPNYRRRVHAAISHGNPDALVTSATHSLSDFNHGHCTHNWKAQQKRLPPKSGRWFEPYNIQWHAFITMGHSWAARGTAHSTESVVDYASKVVQGGGVITFDIGAFDRKPYVGPYLFVPEDQMQQLRAVGKALKEIKRK